MKYHDVLISAILNFLSIYMHMTESDVIYMDKARIKLLTFIKQKSYLTNYLKSLPLSILFTS